MLYVYPGATLEADPMFMVGMEAVDLSRDVEALRLGQAGTAPVRAHMALFTPNHAHAILSYVATGHVVREPRLNLGRCVGQITMGSEEIQDHLTEGNSSSFERLSADRHPNSAP